ncbi:hypothetical protein ScPMuIL_008624 [Solemya velum]
MDNMTEATDLANSSPEDNPGNIVLAVFALVFVVALMVTLAICIITNPQNDEEKGKKKKMYVSFNEDEEAENCLHSTADEDSLTQKSSAMGND